MVDLDKIKAICIRVLDDTFRPLIPYTPADTHVTGPDGITRLRRHSTGKLRKEYTNFDTVDDRHFVIKVDVDYAKYTNEPWISPYWRGKQNPNEGWFQRAALAYAEALATALGGTIK